MTKYLESIILPSADDENTAATFNNKEYINIFYLMKNYNMIFPNGLIEDGVKRHSISNEIVFKFVDITSPKKPKIPIVVQNQTYMKFQQNFSSNYEKNKLLSRPNFVGTTKGISDLHKDIQQYIIGVVFLNILTKTEEEENNDEEFKMDDQVVNDKVITQGRATEITAGKGSDLAFMKNVLEQDQIISSFSTQFKNYLKTLVNREYVIINKFASLPNFSEFLKVILHFGLLLTCFDQSRTGYTKTHKKWQANKISPVLLHNYPTDERYYNLISKLSFVKETRMKERGYEVHYKDIGIYECSCGLVYSLQNCGQANGQFTCPKCNQAIGGANHAHVQRDGHRHFKKFEDLK